MPRDEYVAQRIAEKQKQQRYYARHLYALCKDILGHDRMTEDFHKPMFDDMDERTRLWRAGKYHKCEVELWQRGSYKTTSTIARVIQAYMDNPALTVWWVHAVELKAQAAAREVGFHLQNNKKLREFLPDGAKPPPISKARKWLSAGGFSLPANQGCKDPSMLATGQGSEATGGHADLVILDDVIGENTIQDSLMPKVRRWLGTTVQPILNPGGRIWVRGTHWDEDDIYVDMRKHRDYECRVRACYEDDEGRPDQKHKKHATLFSRRVMDRILRAPGMTKYSASCQYFNTPIPMEERRWDVLREQTCTADEARGDGVIFVLSDPAPAGLSVRGDKDKQRGESGKDYWSLAVVKIRVRGDYQDIILLYGEHSQTWTLTEGFKRACLMMRHWGTRYFFNESYSGDSWTEEFMRVARLQGVSPYLERRDGAYKLPRFKDSYTKNQKNLRIEALCDRNNRREFYVCETCPDDFVHGDKDKVGFLTQVRKWMPLQNGRNNLKWDDDVDVVSRSTDWALLKIAPRPLAATHQRQALSFWALEERDQSPSRRRSLRCGI